MRKKQAKESGRGGISHFDSKTLSNVAKVINNYISSHEVKQPFRVFQTALTANLRNYILTVVVIGLASAFVKLAKY